MVHKSTILQSGGGGGGVTTINGESGDVVLTSTGGTIVITEVGNNINLEASGGSSVSFSALTSGTNTAAAMVVGSGGTLATTGSGTITATAVPASGITGTTLPSGIVTSSLTTVGTLGSLTVTGNITNSTLTATEIVATDGSKNLQSLTTATYPSLTELSYVKGVTSAIQTQINAKGAGTVTAVSIATANGFSGSSSGGATPSLTIVAGAIIPSSVNSVVISGSSTPTLAVTGTATVSGSNTGDQTNITGNAGTVTTNANLTGDVTSSGNATTIKTSVGLAGSPTTTTQSPGDNSTKIATTAYVNAAVLGQDFKEACKYASTAALPSIVYANGSSGVGATLTGVALGAISLDSSSPSVNDRVLIKNQVSTFQNGIYTVTATGSGIAVFVLTRAADFNQSFEIDAGDSVFVTSGTTQSTTTWAYNGADGPTIGTDPITFAQTAGQGSFTAGNGIAITGTSIAIDTSVTVDKTTAQTLTNKTLTAPTLTTPALGIPASGVLTNCTGLPVVGGGTGTSTLTGILKGNGTSAFTAATAGTDYVAPSTVTAFSAQQYFAAQSLTDASPITWNLQTQQAATVLLTSAIGSTRQLQNPTNQQAGATYTLLVQQSSTGSNALTYGTAYIFPGGTKPTLSTANNAKDVLTFISDGTNMYGVAQLAFA